MKKSLVYTVIGLLLLTSCATLFNKPYKTVTISSQTPTKIIYQRDTIEVSDETQLKCPRKKEPLTFTTLNDSIEKTYNISSTISSTIFYNIIGYGGIVGVTIDLFSQKKYSYPHYIAIIPKDSLTNYETHRTTYQGDVFFNLNFPILNIASHQTLTNTSENTINASGLGFGVDYFYSKKNFINFSLNSINDLFTLVETSTVNTYNYIDINRENYFSITHNHQLKKFFIGYGLSIGRNYYNPSEYDNYSFSETPNILKNDVNYAAGFLFNTYIQAGKYLNIGLIYRPSIYTLNSTQPLFHQYYVGIDLRYRFRVKKGANSNHPTKSNPFRENFKHILFPEN